MSLFYRSLLSEFTFFLYLSLSLYIDESFIIQLKNKTGMKKRAKWREIKERYVLFYGERNLFYFP